MNPRRVVTIFLYSQLLITPKHPLQEANTSILPLFDPTYQMEQRATTKSL